MRRAAGRAPSTGSTQRRCAVRGTGTGARQRSVDRPSALWTTPVGRRPHSATGAAPSSLGDARRMPSRGRRVWPGRSRADGRRVGAVSGRELDAAGITDPALRAAYETLPAAERRARQDLLPRHAAAAAGQAAARARALRLRPLRRRAGRRPRRARPGGAGQLGRRSSSPTSTAATATPTRSAGPRSTPPAPGTSRARPSRRSSPACGWTSPSPATRPTPTSSTTCTARPPSSGCRWCRSWSRSTRAPPATPRPSARPSSCPTSSATSPRTSAAAGSTCRRRTSTGSASPAPTSRPGRRRRSVRELLAFEIARTRAPVRRPPSPASTCCTRPAATASAPRSSSTAASSTRSRRPTTRCSTAGSAVPLPRRLRWPSPPWSGRVGPGARAGAAAAPTTPTTLSVCSTSEKPNSRSSTGAKTSRAPEDRRRRRTSRCRGR